MLPVFHGIDIIACIVLVGYVRELGGYVRELGPNLPMDPIAHVVAVLMPVAAKPPPPSQVHAGRTGSMTIRSQ
jgi:hypothetical protein